MDPVSAQAPGPAVARPVAIPSVDLSVVLRQGQVLSGEILQTFDGSTVLIGVGRHRIPAKTGAELSKGFRFLFVVEGSDEEPVLRILSEDEAPSEPALERALRASVSRDEAPLGELLSDLARALEGEPSGAELREQVRARVLDPSGGRSGEADTWLGRLRPQEAPNEARLVAAALPRALRDGRLAEAASVLASWLSEWAAESFPSEPSERGRAAPGDQVASEASGQRAGAAHGDPAARVRGPGTSARAEAAPTGADALGPALARLLGDEAGSGRDLDTRFARWAASRLSGAWEADASPDLRALVELALARAARANGRSAPDVSSLGLERLGAALEVALLAQLVGADLAALESALFELAERSLSGTRSGLRTQLTQSLEHLESGDARAAVERALSGLQAREWLDVARRDAGLSNAWSVPIAEDGSWRTLWMHAERHLDERAADGDAPAASPANWGWRLQFGLELTRLGPIRADLAVRSDALTVRVEVASTLAAERLRSAADEVTARLGLGGRRVRLWVALAKEGDLRARLEGGEFEGLGRHTLMDVEA